MKDTGTQRSQGNAAPAEHAAIAEQVLKVLTKLVNGRKIYAENNPRLQQFRDEFTAALKRMFEIEDELVLTIDQYVIRWNDRVVYENPKREESLAFILFKDGIGEVTIQEQAIASEVDQLVDILASELHNRDTADDVVTRFWNADFEHISYRVLDDYLSGEYGNGAAAAGAEKPQDENDDHPELLPSLADRGRVIVRKADALCSIDAFLRRTLASHNPEGDDRQREALYQRMLRTTFAIPPEETAIYAREFETEKADDGVAAFVEAIFVFTLLSDNPTAVRDVMAIVDRLVDYAAEEKNPATLARLTGFLRKFDGEADLPGNVRDFIRKLLARIANGNILAGMFEQIERPGPYTDAALRYAVAIGEAAIEPLTRALHRLAGNSMHRQVCDALIEIAGDEMTAALERFDIDNPAVAVDAVYIARSMHLPLSPRLRELVFYPEPRVKLEMLEWIAGQDDDESVDLLIASLADLDKRIRMRVLDALTGRAVPRVREKISELAFAKDFNERAADEQEAFFRTLGSVGDVHTVAQIRAMIERRKRIGAGKGIDVKLLAIRALERIKLPAALDVLNRLTEDTAEAVRLRAARASETLSAALATESRIPSRETDR